MTSARDFGIVVVRTSGAEENIICPFHADSSPSASFNKAKGLFYCYVCGVGYNVSQLAEKLSIDLEEVEDGVEVLTDYDFISEDTPLELGEKVHFAKFSYEYFRKRNITPYTCSTYNLHFKEGSFPAAVFPVNNLRGDLIGAVYRFIDPKGNRYVKVGQMTPVWPMFFLLTLKESQSIIVCEGVFSALRLHSFFSGGYKYFPVLCLFGAKANQQIVDTLAPFRPIYLYDHDRAGITACKKMRQISPTSHAFTLSIAPDDMNDRQLIDLGVRLDEIVHEVL